MNTIKSWLIANVETVFIALQVIFIGVIFIANLAADGPGSEDEQPVALAMALGFLIYSSILVYSGKDWKAALFCAGLLCFALYYLLFDKEIEVSLSVKIGAIVCVAVSFVIGLITAISAYRNFDDVVSRRFLYRNSDVSVFENQLLYAINRFYVVFMASLSFVLEVIVFFIIM